MALTRNINGTKGMRTLGKRCLILGISNLVGNKGLPGRIFWHLQTGSGERRWLATKEAWEMYPQ